MFPVATTTYEIKDFVIAPDYLFNALNSTTHHAVIVTDNIRHVKNPHLYFAANHEEAQQLLKQHWLFHEYEQGFHTNDSKRMNNALSVWSDNFKQSFFDQYYERVVSYTQIQNATK